MNPEREIEPNLIGQEIKMLNTILPLFLGLLTCMTIIYIIYTLWKALSTEPEPKQEPNATKQEPNATKHHNLTS